MREIRHEKGLTQDQLAERCDVNARDYIGRIERGAFMPSHERLEIILRGLDAMGELDSLMLLRAADEIIEVSMAGYSPQNVRAAVAFATRINSGFDTQTTDRLLEILQA